MLDMQAWDMERTYADTSFLDPLEDYKLQMETEEGMNRFVRWFKGCKG